MVSEKENREKLFQLMRENPELPVVAMVDSEIVADDGYNRWLGVWGCSYIGEYLVGEEQVHFREDDDPSEVDKVLSERYGDDYYTDMTDEQEAEAYAGLPWVKAIIVNMPSSMCPPYLPLQSSQAIVITVLVSRRRLIIATIFVLSNPFGVRAFIRPSVL